MADWTDPEIIEDGDYLPASHLNNLRDRLDFLYRGQTVRLHQAQPEITAPANEWSVVPHSLIDADTQDVMGDVDNPTQIPIEKDGIYLLQGSVNGDYTDVDSFTGDHFGRIRVAGRSVVQQGGWSLQNVFPGLSANMLTAWWCKAGDLVDLGVYAAKGGTPNIGLWSHLTATRVAMPWRPGDPDWTTPQTWTASVPDATDFDELGNQVRYLRNRTAARIQSDADQSVPNNTATALTMRRKVFGPPSMHVPGTSVLVLPVPGIWVFGGQAMFAKNTSGAIRYADILRNGVTREAAFGRFVMPVLSPRIALWNINSFSAGDTLTLRALHDRGSALAAEHHYPTAQSLWAVHLGVV